MSEPSASGRELSEPPYGITDRHFEPRHRAWFRPLLQISLITVVLLAALLGWLGGGPEKVSRVTVPDVRVEVSTARVLRSGNWFETQVRIVPQADIADLAIGFDEPLWRAMSIDTLLPDAESAEFAEGRFTFRFGPAKRGEPFLLKIDGQIQPRWFRVLSGRVTVLDGERELATAPVRLTVLP